MKLSREAVAELKDILAEVIGFDVLSEGEINDLGVSLLKLTSVIIKQDNTPEP